MQSEILESRNDGGSCNVHVHIRTTRVEGYGGRSYSYISTAAVKFAESMIEISQDGSYLINGSPSEVFGDKTVSSTISLAGYTLKRYPMGSKGKITAFEIDLRNDRMIKVRCNTKVGMIYIAIEGHFPNSEGLLGAPAGEDDRMLSRNKLLDMTHQWNSFGEEWQVKGSDPKLFADEKRFPQYPIGCLYDAPYLKQHKNKKLRRRLLEHTMRGITLEDAKEACQKSNGHLNQFCVDDVMAAGDTELADDPFYF